MGTRDFTTIEIMAMLDLPEGTEWFAGWDEYEQAGSARRYVYLAKDGKIWRFDPKTNTDGEDELQQEIDEYLRRRKLGKEPLPYGESVWEAVEVELRTITVKKYVEIK